ncbi:MAG: ABC transporter [Beggiatoa sp. IS2]|nr:MAG: ABC transporter [Beggiatoa sp. IS2]
MEIFAFFLNNCRIILKLGLFFSILAGCTTNPANPDPLEKFNRHIFTFNEKVDKVILKPVAQTYQAVVPKPVDEGVTNFFSNINDVVVVTNDVFQFKFKQAATDTTRLLLNSTLGIFGVFDIASKVGLPKHEEDFGQTLGYWGLESGPYLMLPFFGPSSLRDLAGRGVDILADPRVYYADEAKLRNFFMTTDVVKIIDMRADYLDMEQVLDTAALDRYTYIRDAYLQRRKYLVYDGNLPKEILEEEGLFDDIKPQPKDEMKEN